MSEKHFTSLPSATDSRQGGGFKPMTRTSLPVFNPAPQQKLFPPLVVIPSVPTPPSDTQGDFAGNEPVPMGSMPSQPVRQESIGFLPEIFLPSETPPAEPVEKKSPPVETAAEPLAEENPFQAAPDYSDEDLTDAFAPIVEGAVRKAVYAMEKGNVDALLEPMLRVPLRRQTRGEFCPAHRPPNPGCGRRDSALLRAP
ncbi:MAG: hypothetical protein IZT59_06300 [Verrucomicrobia bacterium]|nr:hypothetical protein [Verrucomicrobiota bacterium]|tara:strand:- start:441 stop:1034 length:594 start_codon:yes stop_codon:yes gene_type:complete